MKNLHSDINTSTVEITQANKQDCFYTPPTIGVSKIAGVTDKTVYNPTEMYPQVGNS